MKVWGLTGGAGMGKTIVAQLLANRGANVVDADVLSRQLVEPGMPALEEIRSYFGESVIGPDGHLRRDQLASLVFANDAARHSLEEILHYRIRFAWQNQLDEWRLGGKSLAVVVIPLLFETSAHASFNQIICVGCLSCTQHKRLLARGWPPLQIAQRLAAQWPIDRKMAASDKVLWTEGRLESTVSQIDRIMTAG